ncbi:hypothetical protein OAD57_04355 [Porticoccaceae bacterium]|nr:hypothetical protein [Porticoccaceae bacterium]
MFFDIDADLVYTRPYMTKVDGKAVVIEENVTVVPTKNWKRIYISSNLIAAMQDELTDLNDIFDIDQLGQMFAASAFITYKDIDCRDEPFIKLMVNTEFNALGDKEHAMSLWNSDHFVDAWQSAFESFEHYFKEYSEVRYGIITDQWFEDDNGKEVTHSTEKYRKIGDFYSDNWYEEGFRFTGFKNIRAIKLFNADTGKRNKATLEKVIKTSVLNLQDAAYQAGESIEDYQASIDIDSFKRWHNGRIKYFQQKYTHNNALRQYLIIKKMDNAHLLRRAKTFWHSMRFYLTYGVVGFGIGYGAVIAFRFITE